MNENQKITANLGIMHHTIRKFAYKIYGNTEWIIRHVCFCPIVFSTAGTGVQKSLSKRSGTVISNFQSHCVTHAFQNGAEESRKKKGKCGRCTV